jgi:cytochrome c oxidase cbb3-type subunit III
MAHHEEHDAVTGRTTTGHEWDGIKELNTPLPRWWVYMFYASIVWSIGYWVVYPAWPTISGYTSGWFEYSTRAQLRTELADLEKLRGEKAASLAATPLPNIVRDPALLSLARARGKVAFADNCAPCHGSGAAGAKGYPNLNDDDWLWGGSLDEIKQTLDFGIRSGHAKAREGSMMPFGGKDGILKRDEIRTVTNFVRSLSGLSVAAGIDLDAGRKLFAANCAACHGDDGKGKLEIGAPSLADKIWLYGSDEAAIIESITNGRGGVMPAWSERLDPVTLKALTVYVYSLSGGK